MDTALVVRAVKRRWQVAAVAIASGLVVAAIAHPDWGVHDYQATHRLYSPAAARGDTSGGPAPLVDPFVLKPAAIAALATSEQTATRAAAELGFDGDPMRLVARVRAIGDDRAGTIEVSARRRADPRGAVLIADTVAEQLVELVDESRAAARQRAIDSARERAATAQEEIDKLEAEDAATLARADALLKTVAAAQAEAESLQNASETSGISTIQPAVARQLPSHFIEALPPLFGWLLTLLLLSGLGAGLAVAVHLTDDRVADAAAAESSSGLPVLSVIAVDDTGDAETHRRLQATLLGPAPSGPSGGTQSFVVPKVRGAGRLVVVTAPIADGATTEMVIGFAAAVAETGRTALIVDCNDDGHDAAAAREGAPVAQGVADLAAGGIVLSSLSSLVQPTSMPRVSLVPHGAGDGSAAEFLVRHDRLVHSARDLADVVILHAPAVLDDPHTAELAKLAEDTLVVCRTGETRVADMRRAAVALYEADANGGVVLLGEPSQIERVPFSTADLAARVRSDAKLRGRLEWAGAGVAMLVLYALLRSFVVESFSIPTASMAPYLDPGDRVLVSRLSYRLHDVHRGDVIVFKTPTKARSLGGSRLIKRVIALPGETVESKDGKILVNGKALPEDYLPNATTTENVKRQKVPSGRYWVMGDNRDNSADSRFFGTITKGSIIGRAFFHLWPWPIGLM